MAFSEMNSLNLNIYSSLDQKYFQIDLPLNKDEIKVFLINWRHYEGLQPQEKVQSNLLNQIGFEKILDNMSTLVWQKEQEEINKISLPRKSNG